MFLSKYLLKVLIQLYVNSVLKSTFFKVLMFYNCFVNQHSKSFFLCNYLLLCSPSSWNRGCCGNSASPYQTARMRGLSPGTLSRQGDNLCWKRPYTHNLIIRLSLILCWGDFCNLNFYQTFGMQGAKQFSNAQVLSNIYFYI